jgi:hypothetical protein
MLDLEFELLPEEDNTAHTRGGDLRLGHLTVRGDLGCVSSKGRSPNQAMMIFDAAILMLVGLTESRYMRPKAKAPTVSDDEIGRHRPDRQDDEAEVRARLATNNAKTPQPWLCQKDHHADQCSAGHLIAHLQRLVNVAGDSDRGSK